MKLFKHSVESKDYKREINKFFQRKVKPILLSVKHFFKSSHVFFKNHPRLRFASATLGIFVLIIVISAVLNTFSAPKLAFENDDYNGHRDEYWNQLYNYRRPNINLSYASSSSNTGSCAA